MRQNTYTDQVKHQTRRLLIIHGGDIGIVHQLTNIPKRTLYRWRTAWDDQYDLFTGTLAQKKSDSATAIIPSQSLLSPITADDHINYRVIALSRLIDRIVLIDQIFPDQTPEKVVRFEFISDGKVSSTPPWETDPTE